MTAIRTSSAAFWDRQRIRIPRPLEKFENDDGDPPIVAIVDNDCAALVEFRAHPENLDVLALCDLRTASEEEPEPRGSHALGCAALVGGKNGVAPGTPLIVIGSPVEPDRQSEILRWVAGLAPIRKFDQRLATPLPKGADIILMSLLVFDQPELVAALADLVRFGRNGKGAVICLAAGNFRGPQAQAIARHGHCLTVGASTLDENGREFLAPYSNYGKYVDLYAPSGARAGRSCLGKYDKVVLAALPLGGSGPQGEDDLIRPSAEFFDEQLRNDYMLESGTSTSAALCAGVVALMLRANPELTFQEVKSILRSTAIRLSGSEKGDLRRIDAAEAISAARYAPTRSRF